jgi:hypothetical protein
LRCLVAGVLLLAACGGVEWLEPQPLEMATYRGATTVHLRGNSGEFLEYVELETYDVLIVEGESWKMHGGRCMFDLSGTNPFFITSDETCALAIDGYSTWSGEGVVVGDSLTVTARLSWRTVNSTANLAGTAVFEGIKE